MPQNTLPFYLDTRAPWICHPPIQFIYPKSTTVIVMLTKQGLCYLATPVSKGQHVGNCVRLHSPASFIETSVHWPLSSSPCRLNVFACTFDSPNWRQKATATYEHFEMLQNWPRSGFKIHVALFCAVLWEPDVTLSFLDCLIINKTLWRIWWRKRLFHDEHEFIIALLKK